MALTWMLDVFRDAGLKVSPVAGWEKRGASMNMPKVVIAHHTATRPTSPDSAIVNLLVKGRPDLPGPLAHVGLARDGTVFLIAAGRANHAGAGSWKGVTGNSNAFGIEAFNDGVGEKWPQIQLDAYDQICASVLAQAGRDATWLCAHREWAPRRKIDPTGIDMNLMRGRVELLLNQSKHREVPTVWVNNIPGHQYEYKADSTASKFAVDYWQRVFAELDPGYKFTPGVWDEAFVAQCVKWGGTRQGVGPGQQITIEQRLFSARLAASGSGGAGSSIPEHQHKPGGVVR